MAALALMIALGVQAEAPPAVQTRASAAECADRLIDKNHDLAVETLVLARRITDECYKDPPAAGEGAPTVTPELWRDVKADFERIVQDRVVAARARALKLAR